MELSKFLKNSIYEELGVSPIIQAAGTKSSYGGSRMSEEVLEAIFSASRSFVSISELNRKIGKYIAEITGAESGMVTSGAGSGVVLSIAACMTGTNIAKIRQLPNTDGMKDEMIIQKIHRGSYSHMYTFSGAKLIEIGNINECLPEELESAFTEKTAAVNYLIGPRISRSGLSLPEVVKIAHEHNVPVIVDAAAMLPPKINLRKYIEQGADLVTFSGGKMIRGPQATGLLFGRKHLIDAALANANPNHSIGRAHKVSREDMVGLYVALKLYLQSDEREVLDNLNKQLLPIIHLLANVPHVNATIIHDGINYNVPVVIIQFSDGWKGPTGLEFTKKMLDGNPRIFMQYFKELDHLVVNPISLQEGEAEIVAHRLKAEIYNYIT